MKKILSVVAAVALAATVFVACSSETADDGRNSYIDTYKLDAVDITVKAYPGFNYISWGSSTTGATVSVLRDDGKTITANVPGSANAAIDADIKNGATYKYTAYVYTNGDNSEVSSGNQWNTSNTSNEYKTYYTVKGNSKSASATGIKPDYYDAKGNLVTALDLCNYEKGGNKNYVLSEKNLNLNVEPLSGRLYVSFPTKAYLNYFPMLFAGNEIDTFGLTSADRVTIDSNYEIVDSVGFEPNFYKMDDTYSWNTGIYSAGTYQVAVSVGDWTSGFNTTGSPVTVNYSEYAPSVVYSKLVTIDALDVAAKTQAVAAGYIDAGKTIRFVWRPATKTANNNEAWAASNYKVYVKKVGLTNSSVKNTYEEIASTEVKKGKQTAKGLEVKSDTLAGETVYYVEYAVEDNSVAYQFYAVLSDNGKYEDNKRRKDAISAEVASYGKLAKLTYGRGEDITSAGAYFSADNDDDDLNNDAVIKITVTQNENAPRIVVDSIKYIVVGKNTDTAKVISQYTKDDVLVDSEFKEAAVVPSADFTEYGAIVKNVALGSKVVFLYTVKQEGKENYVDWATTTGYASVSTTITSEFSIAANATANSFKFTINTGVTVDRNLYEKDIYTYKLYYAKVLTGTSVNNIDSVTTTWTEIPVTISWDTAGTYKGSADHDFSSEITTPVYNSALETDGSKKIDSYTDTFAFKLVKTNTKANGYTGSVATAYGTALVDSEGLLTTGLLKLIKAAN